MSEKAKDFYNSLKGSDQELNDDGSVKGLFEIMQAYADQETSEIEYECEILERQLKVLQQHLENQKAIQSALYTEHIKKYQEST